jgi:hypothetical protein
MFGSSFRSMRRTNCIAALQCGHCISVGRIVVLAGFIPSNVSMEGWASYSENGTLPSLGVTEGQYGPALTLLANYMAGSFVTAAMAAHRSRKGKPGSRCWHIRERDNVGDRPMTSLSAVQRSVQS